jgi:hypothetical protein
VAAKVTRDAWVEGWLFEEDDHFAEKVEEEVVNQADQGDAITDEAAKEQEKGRLWAEVLGSGYPSGWLEVLSLFSELTECSS